MVMKGTVKVYAKEGMSRDEFVKYWLTKHAPLAKQKFGNKLKKYVISVVVSAEGEEPGYQGTAELWFDISPAELQTMMSSPAFKQVMADSANFTRKVTMLIVEEHTIV
jgi:uncharacterized protein (TIGR02118 family)